MSEAKHSPPVSSNHGVALKAEMKRVTRCFNAYSSEQRANNLANFRAGYQQRESIGEFFYVHPDVPNRAFTKRKLAAAYALTQAAVTLQKAKQGDKQ